MATVSQDDQEPASKPTAEERYRSVERLIHHLANSLYRKYKLDRDELFSEITLRFVKYLPAYDKSRSKLSTWTTMIAGQTAITLAKARDCQKRRHHDVQLTAEHVATIPHHDDDRRDFFLHEQLQHALPALPPRERDLVHRRFFQGQSLRDIAEQQGVSRQCVQQIQKRALNRLRQQFGGPVGEG